MRQNVAERVPLALARGVEQQETALERDRKLIGDIDATRSTHPTQLGIKQHQTHQPEPKNRHRVADQAHDSYQLINPTTPPDRRPHPQGHAQAGTDQDAQGS